MENQGNSTNSSSSENNIEELKKRAEQGDAEAQYDLALNYEQGWDVEQNNQKAVEWYMKSAKNGYVFAQRRLASCYRAGILGLELDYVKASYWSQKASESVLKSEKEVGWYDNKFEKAQYQHGMRYAEGSEEDWKRAIDLFKKIQYSLYSLGIDADKRAFVNNALSAEEGNAEAQYQLGNFYSHVSRSYNRENAFVVEKDWKKAIKWYTKAAKQGHADAQYTLGMCYAEGRGVKEDWQKAIEWFKNIQDKLNYLNISEDKKAFVKNAVLAENGDIEAQYWLGFFYSCYAHSYAYNNENIYGVKQNWKKSIEWYTKAAGRGHVGAQYTLGMHYAEGEGVEENWQKAIEWFNNIQDKLDSPIVDGHKKEFVKNAILAEKGDPEAQYQLGNFYASGWDDFVNDYGVKKDWQKAIEWYTKAAEQGYAEAQYTLGMRYAEGKGVKQDWQKAIEWYTKAAEQGHAEALYTLGMYYAKGEGVEEDWKKAVEWFKNVQDKLDSLNIDKCKKAFVKNAFLAEKGNAESQYQLGNFYASGSDGNENAYGIKQDWYKAVEWYVKAAEQGHAEAKNGLANARFVLGVNCLNDIDAEWKKAVEYFEKIQNEIDSLDIDNDKKVFVKNVLLADQGNMESQYLLGICFIKGRNVKENTKKAVKWYKKAADHGHAKAQYKLGLLYSSKSYSDVEQNWQTAAYWFEKASDQGYAKAQFWFGMCLAAGKGITQDWHKAVDLFAKAAEQGYADAQYRLGMCYMKGTGIDPDRKKAQFWLEKAKEQGHPEAKAIIWRHFPNDSCYFNGDSFSNSDEKCQQK